MKGYVIKVTYMDGIHKGESYLLGKGTKVMSGIMWSDYCYKSIGIANRICKKWYEENELNKRIERENEKRRTAKGGEPKKWYIYESETYEPFEVEMVCY